MTHKITIGNKTFEAKLVVGTGFINDTVNENYYINGSLFTKNGLNALGATIEEPEKKRLYAHQALSGLVYFSKNKLEDPCTPISEYDIIYDKGDM